MNLFNNGQLKQLKFHGCSILETMDSQAQKFYLVEWTAVLVMENEVFDSVGSCVLMWSPIGFTSELSWRLVQTIPISVWLAGVEEWE